MHMQETITKFLFIEKKNYFENLILFNLVDLFKIKIFNNKCLITIFLNVFFVRQRETLEY